MRARAFRSAAWVVVAVFLFLVVWTVYANVLSDDLGVRSLAEEMARAKAGCGEKCTLLRMEGSRGAFKETIEFTFRDAGVVTATCRRTYVAFGGSRCDVSPR